MSLAPLNRGVAGNGVLTLAPGWTIKQNEFGVDVLNCKLAGTVTDVIAHCPAKYDPCVLPGLNYPQLICSMREIDGNEGKSGFASLEYKGFLGAVPNPQSEGVWTLSQWTSDFGTATVTFTIPSTFQYTLKFGSKGPRGAGQIGQYAVPFGADGLPAAFVAQVKVIESINVIWNINMQSIGATLHCVKDDWNCIGDINEVTQVWEKYYYPFGGSVAS